MLKNYITTAFRNLWRNKTISLINVLGLGIGISASLVIYLIVKYDFSFDKFHKDPDKIFRVVSKFDFQGEAIYNGGVTFPLGNVMQTEVTGLEEVAAFSPWNSDTKVSLPRNTNEAPIVFKNQSNIVFANEKYFRLFNYKWLAGSPQSSLNEPYQVVLSEAKARVYFPKLKPGDIIGRQFILNDTVSTTITGIVKDLPGKTDFTFQTFVSRITQEKTSLKPRSFDNWGSTSSASQLLVKLAPGTSSAQIQKQLAAIYLKYNKPTGEEKKKVPYLLQPLSDLHFNGNYNTYFDNHLAHKPTLYGLLAVGAFLLLLGCINFINLTTAQASRRAKEIGIRKTMGSSKAQLVLQYLSETLLLTSIASLLSVGITPLLLSIFKDFIPSGLHFRMNEQPELLLFLLGLMIAVTILAGLYPAFILSGYKPLQVLKNQAYNNTGTTRGLWLRKTLTISQFAIAQVFIIATILVSKQINYTLNKDLGFKKDAIIYFETNYFDTSQTKRVVLQKKLESIHEIAIVSLSHSPIMTNGKWSTSMKYKDGKKETETHVQMKMADTNYIRLYGLKILAGRNVSPSDTAKELIINETYAHVLGFREPQLALGKYIEWDNSSYPIVGIVADFHQESLHEPIKPLAISTLAEQQRTFNIALQNDRAENPAWKPAITKIEKAFNEVYPNDDFSYSFQDKAIEEYYRKEQDISRLLVWSTGLTIFISCLGLLGLAIYITNQRTKEIGIRKVIGATVLQLIALLSKDFLKLILLAFIIAVPITWWSANKWLENFAYRTSVTWWIFIAGGMIMLAVACIVLIMKTFKVAAANPVKSLRTE
jgi:predicted permease